MITVAGSEAVIHSIVPKARADEIGDVVRLHLVPPTAKSQPPPMRAVGSVAQELARLAKLRQSGGVSDAEFEDQKSKLLEG